MFLRGGPAGNPNAAESVPPLQVALSGEICLTLVDDVANLLGVPDVLSRVLAHVTCELDDEINLFVAGHRSKL